MGVRLGKVPPTPQRQSNLRAVDTAVGMYFVQKHESGWAHVVANAEQQPKVAIGHASIEHLCGREQDVRRMLAHALPSEANGVAPDFEFAA